MGTLLNLKKSSRAALCVECGKCSTMCPLAEYGGFSAARVMSIEDPDTEIHGHAEAVQRCLTCGSCEVRCPQGVRYTEFVRGLRQELPDATRMACPHGQALQWAARLESEAQAPERDLSWIGTDVAIAEEGDVALFVGCLPLFDAAFARGYGVDVLQITRSAVRLLNRLGIEPVILPQERCCGHDLFWNGEQETFERLARANTQAFEDRGIETILTTCAECCRTWRLDYPKVVPGYQPRVEHLAEFLAPRLESGELALHPSDNGPVTFHDPCRLGRQLGVYDAPRRVLEAVPGCQVTEMERSGQDSLCCGTSGFIHCDSSSRRIQSERLAGAAATGATTLITACPKCLIHFHCAQTEDRRTGRARAALQVEDLTVWAAGFLDRPNGSKADLTDKRQLTGEAQ